jgi:hypothetical protein
VRERTRPHAQVIDTQGHSRGPQIAIHAAEAHMTLKQYFPLSILAFVATVMGIHYISWPVAPFVIILLAAETLVGFELEDHRVPKLLHEIFRAPKHGTSENH